MSNQLTINASGLNLFNNPVAANSTQNSAAPVQGAVTGGFDITACIVNISKQGREKAQNQAVDEERRKRQEFWAQRKLLTYGDVPHTMAEPWVYDDPCWKDVMDMMRTNEPETYAEYKDLVRKAGGKLWVPKTIYNNDGFTCEFEVMRTPTDEQVEYHTWAFKLINDWFYRRCVDEKGAMYNPNIGRSSVCKKLENKYTDVNFDVYSEKYGDSGLTASTLQNYNVRLSVEAVTALAKVDMPYALTKEDAEEIMEWTERIDQAVAEIKNVTEQYHKEMKALEEQFEGRVSQRLVKTKFGVALGTDGKTTYYSNYEHCDGETRITASSPEELLQILREKETLRMSKEKAERDAIDEAGRRKREFYQKHDFHFDPSKAVDLEPYMMQKNVEAFLQDIPRNVTDE